MSSNKQKSGVLEVALVGAILLLANAGLWAFFGSSGSNAPTSSPEQLRALASKLSSVGIKGEAAKYYEEYLDVAEVSDKTRAQVGLALAKLLKEDGQLEEALAYLYRVETWDPNSEAARDAAPLIVEILDRLGLGQAAQTALSNRSRLVKKTPDAQPTEKVVAKIGDQSLTLSDLDRAIEGLPPQLAQGLETPEGKRQFLNQFVAQKLLYHKALNRGLDKDPRVRRQLDDVTEQILISRMLEEEFKDKVRVSEDDLRTFHKAHADQFVEQDGKPAPFDDVVDKVKQAYLMSKVQSLSQELLSQAQAAQEVQLFPDVLAKDSPSSGK